MDDFFNSVYNFGLGGIAGGIGAFAVYPIDLVKTRYVDTESLRAGHAIANANMMTSVDYKTKGAMSLEKSCTGVRLTVSKRSMETKVVSRGSTEESFPSWSVLRQKR